MLRNLFVSELRSLRINEQDFSKKTFSQSGILGKLGPTFSFFDRSAFTIQSNYKATTADSNMACNRTQSLSRTLGTFMSRFC